MTFKTLWQQLLPQYDAREAQAVVRLALETLFGFTLTDLYEDTNGEGRLHELHIPSFIATRAVK